MDQQFQGLTQTSSESLFKQLSNALRNNSNINELVMRIIQSGVPADQLAVQLGPLAQTSPVIQSMLKTSPSYAADFMAAASVSGPAQHRAERPAERPRHAEPPEHKSEDGAGHSELGRKLSGAGSHEERIHIAMDHFSHGGSTEDFIRASGATKEQAAMIGREEKAMREDWDRKNRAKREEEIKRRLMEEKNMSEEQAARLAREQATRERDAEVARRQAEQHRDVAGMKDNAEAKIRIAKQGNVELGFDAASAKDFDEKKASQVSDAKEDKTAASKVGEAKASDDAFASLVEDSKVAKVADFGGRLAGMRPAETADHKAAATLG